MAGVAIAAAVAVIGIITTMTEADKAEANALEKKAEAQKAATEAAKKDAEEKNKEIETNTELVDSYLSLSLALKNNEATREEVRNSVAGLSKAYDDEKLLLLELQGEYDKLTEAILRKHRAELND